MCGCLPPLCRYLFAGFLGRLISLYNRACRFPFRQAYLTSRRFEARHHRQPS